MAFHEFPTPDDTTSIPIWSVYACAVVVNAARGLIPDNTLALDVRISDEGWTISLEFQVCEATADDIEDMEEIWDDFCTSIPADVGHVVNPIWSYIIVDEMQPVSGPGDVYRLYARNPRQDPRPTPTLHNPSK